MKVLYVSKALHVAAYRAKLSDLAHHVEVLAVVPERWGTQSMEPGDEQHIRRVPAFLHGHNHLHFYRSAASPIEEFAPDLVHIDEEPYSAVTAQYVRACSRRRVPCLFFAWQNIDKRLPTPFGSVRRYVFRHVAGGVAGTTAAGEVLRANGYAGPLAIVPQFGVDPDRFRPDAAAAAALRAELHVPADDLVVGFGGRLVMEKGITTLFDAVARVSGLCLVIAGDGPLRPALEQRARAADLYGRVRFLGAVPSSDMPRTLAGMDVLALPSRTTTSWKEQFGRILVEAMACGVSVIGSDSGEIPDVIGCAGIVLPEGDTNALAEALTALRDSPARRATLARDGRARVLDHFTGAGIAARTADFYAEVAR